MTGIKYHKEKYMKLGKIIDTRFRTVVEKLAKQEIPLRTAFKMRGLTKRINEEVEKYEATRQEGLQKHGEKDADGKLVVNPDNTVKFSQEGMQAFAAELNDLTLTSIELDTLSVAELGTQLKITTEELTILGELITE